MKKEMLGQASFISFAFILLSLSLVLFSNGEEKVLLIFLPLIYGVFFISLARIHKYFNYPGMFVLNVISAIRYVLIPTLIIIYPDYNDQYGSLTAGILFMIFEAMCLGIFLIFITKKYYSGRKIEKHVEVNSEKNILLKLVVILSIFIVMLNPSILLQYNFVFMDSHNIELIKSGALVSGLSGIFVDWGKLFLPILITIPLIRKYRKNNNDIYYYLVIIIIMVFNVLVFSGTSRNSVIMPAVASMFFLLKAFPKKRRKIFLFMSVSIVIVALQLTILKTEYLGTRIQASLGDVIDYLELYFGGPKNMSIAIIAKETYSNMFTINTVINDILGNFPGLSHLFNMENRTTTFFNLSFYGGGAARDQIIPSMGQGLFYFGYLFSFIPQAIIVYGMAKFDSIYRNTKDLSGIYFISYFAVRFGFTYSQNVSIILNFIYVMTIPIMIILLIDRMINKRFKFRRSYFYEKNKTAIYNK
ncbi:oligosaccharide repeat unit polymerase [Oceanobacillus senegalensis]|uniref:oligosaccharide repeat unit polymerase n=1 Tax=Oceanobacillus senegalensis TaxID=1936063 RepID=UPI000A3050B8|nr:oligosaccharide repeat unit polymerase [Oceanobacillus senegalensis]